MKHNLILHNQQQDKIEQIVLGANSLVNHFYQMAERGELSEKSAKTAAIEVLKSYRYQNDNYVWVQDFSPKMIMHPFKPELNGQSLTNISDPDGLKLFVKMVDVVKQNGRGVVSYKWPKPGADEAVAKASFVAEFEPWGWIIGTGVYNDNIALIYAQQRNIMLAISVVVLVIISLGIMLVAKSIVAPTKQAADLMQNIAAGESDLTRQLTVSGKDEITALSRFFNTFTEKIQHSLIEVSASSKYVFDSSKELAQVTRASSEFVQAQNDNTTQVATAMEQMTANTKEISQNAELAELAVTQAKNHTDTGKHTLDMTIAHIEDLSDKIQSVTKTVNGLADESNNITAVLDVIKGIAEQTNLLALNAAIEAARAGEQGRGFAVVADEVRNLASKTGESTDEIQHMISKLQSYAKDAVEAVHGSQSVSEKTVATVNQAGEALAEIDTQIAKVFDMNSEIARATDEQSQVATDVNLRINELSQMTSESMAMTSQLAATSEELKSSSDKLFNVLRRFKL
ncbi:methyl-accepting chemotaxis protein [Gayadomonas joobiniege]|uniref:methyl-accepting chemotaxis protein n=1 Tax=Gayadomonas joobiniege TaxID=1234606 RepID=UPI001ED9C585|nr:methyl-accepting chemotaxis protein [Gayadomonas joobiniege]